MVHLLALGDNGGVDDFLWEDIRWDLFLSVANRSHRVSSILYKKIRDHGCSYIPEEVITALGQQNHDHRLHMLKLTGELIRVGRLLTDAGLPYLAYKGPALGCRLYQDPGIRYAVDLDLVLPMDRIMAAVDILLASGYVLHSPSYAYSSKQMDKYFAQLEHLTLIHGRSGIKVELHWKFFTTPLCDLTMASVWKNQELIQIGSHAIPMVGGQELLILLLLHGGKHHWNRLSWVCDIRELIAGYGHSEWECLMNRVRELKIQRPVHYAFLIIAELFKGSLPSTVLAAAESDKNAKRLARRTMLRFWSGVPVAKHALRGEVEKAVHRFMFLPHFKYRLELILRNLLYWETEYLPLPDRFRFFYYLFRPYLWFFRQVLKIPPASRPLPERGE